MGLSRLPRLFIVVLLALAAIPVVAEEVTQTEPNDTPGTADLIATGLNGDVGAGTVEVGDEVDWWRVSGVSAGDYVYAFLWDAYNPQQGWTGAPWVRIWANDTTSEIGKPNSLTTFDLLRGTVPQNGNVYFEVRDLGNNDTLVYRLFQAIVSPTDSAAEVEPNNTPWTATKVTAPIMTGNVAVGEVDYFEITIPGGSGSHPVVAIADNDPDDDCYVDVTANPMFINCTETEMTLYWQDGTTVVAEDRVYLNYYNSLEPPYWAFFNGDTYYLKVSGGSDGTDTDYSIVMLVDGNAACLETTGCALFTDGFESGDTSVWTLEVP